MSDAFVQLRAGLIHCPKRGLGDPVLLVHGIYPGASREEWTRTISNLAGQFTVFAPDLLGFGESDAPKLTFTNTVYHHLLRELIVNHVGGPCAVIASGVSCAFATRLAVYDDPLVSKLVLVCPVDRESHPQPTASEKLQQFVYGTLGLGDGIYDSVVTRSALRSFLEDRFAKPERLKDELLERIQYNAARPNSLYPFLSLLTGYYDLSVLSWLRYVRASTLVVWGDGLGEPPTKEVERPAAWSRGKQIAVIPDAKHWPQEEQSAKFGGIVRQFLLEP